MTEGGRSIEIIPIHFDVPGHEIPLATFIRTAQETEAVISGLNTELFEGRLQFEMVVLPPDEGTFLQRLGVYLLAGWGFIWTFTGSDVGKGFIKGLTGHEPAYWAEMAGKATVHATQSLTAEARTAEAEKNYGTVIVSEAAKSFLQKDRSELERVGITPGGFRAAYAARNGFYEACDATPRLRAIGFSEASVFPIRKEDFVRFQTDLPPKSEEAEPPWQVGTAVLKVTSPNWDRSDGTRSWKGRDQQGRERYFRIDDEEFWSRVATGGISAHVIDTMRVQWAFRGRPDQPKNCRVLRVLEFNGEALARPLSANALAAQLGKLAELGDDQYDLFRNWPGEPA